MKSKNEQTHREKMTAAQARTFEAGESLASYMQVAELLLARKEEDEAFEECECEPYQDVFTFNRWLAQGMAVQKGQKSLRHAAYVPTNSTDVDAPQPKEGEQPRKHLRPVLTFLFCRCQVAKQTTSNASAGKARKGTHK